MLVPGPRSGRRPEAHDVIKIEQHKILRKNVTVVFILLLAACSSGVIVHDHIRAAELVVDFLSSLKSEADKKLAYEWTDDKYKQAVSFPEFTRIVAEMRGKVRGADIRLTGYEVFGARETLNVYASSDADEGKIFIKFSLVGSKSKDYYLIDLNTNDTEFDKSGIQGEYGESIIIQGI